MNIARAAALLVLILAVAGGASSVESQEVVDLPDVGFVDPHAGVWDLGRGAPFYYGVPGDVPFLGDWDGDGTKTPGLYRPSTGFGYVRNSNTSGVADVSWYMGIPGDIPVVGDWDGDGIDSFGVFRPSEARVYLRNALTTGVADVSYDFGIAGDTPFAGDFNGDGLDEIGLHRRSTGFVYLRYSHTTGVADNSFFWGQAGDVVVAGDWDGDGTDTVGLLRPTDATFYFRNSNSLGVADGSFDVLEPMHAPVVGYAGELAATAVAFPSGEAVVPGPGAATVDGWVVVRAGAGRVCYSALTDGGEIPTSITINRGLASVSGPVSLDLDIWNGLAYSFSDAPGYLFIGCRAAPPWLVQHLHTLTTPYYVEFVDPVYPAGAIRGQIVPSDTPPPPDDVPIVLPGSGHDVEVDVDAGLVYVSLPDDDAIAVVDLETFEPQGTIPVGDEPRGIDLSDDGSTLYIALAGSGSIEVFDLALGSQGEISVAAELLHQHFAMPTDPWEVLEVIPGTLLVTAKPAGFSGPYSHVVKVELGNPPTVTRLAPERTGRFGGPIAADPVRGYAYVGTSESVYKFDVADPEAPLILENRDISAPEEMALSADGAWLYANGRIVRAGSLLHHGPTVGGPPVVGPGPGRHHVLSQPWAEPPFAAHGYHTPTLTHAAQWRLDCDLPWSGDTYKGVFAAERLLVLKDNILCFALDRGGEWDLPPDPLQTILSGLAHDVAIDDARGVAYLSITTGREIAVVDLESQVVVELISLGGSPYGIDLSADGSSLYVALYGAGAVGIIDLDSRDITEISVLNEIGDLRTWDVVEGLPGVLFVTANPGSSGLAYVARVDLGGVPTVSRVASGRVIRSDPFLAVDPAGHYLLVTDSDFLSKLDLADPAVPFLFRRFGAPFEPEVSPDGALIYERDGRVIRSSDFIEVATTEIGLSRVHPDGSTVYVATSEDVVSVSAYDTTTHTLIGQSTLECGFDADQGQNRAIRGHLTADGQTFVLFRNDLYCMFDLSTQ